MIHKMFLRMVSAAFAASAVSCVPQGYMQSPRVSPGVEIGSIGYVRSGYPYTPPPKPTSDSIAFPRVVQQRFFSSDSSESFSVLLASANVECGILDRVRLGFSLNSAEIMVNVIDRGSPHLFKNIAVGVMANASAVSIYEIGNVAGGILFGTHSTTSHGGDFELVLGTGGSYNRGEEWWGGRADLYTYERSHTAYFLDLAASAHVRPFPNRKFQLTAGAGLSKAVKASENYTVYSREDKLNGSNMTKHPLLFTAQTGVSIRFGGSKGAARIAEHPRIFPILRCDSLAILKVKANRDSFVRINGTVCTDDRAVIKNLKPGNYLLETVQRDGRVIDSRVVRLSNGDRIQYYVRRYSESVVQVW